MAAAWTRPETVFIGDDFTGASDTLATFSRSGRRTRLFLSPPKTEDCAGLDAVGIATALRSMGADAIRRECAVIAQAVAGFGARFYHYKVCSTFDSSADTGSIAAAVSSLQQILEPALTLIIGGQPSLGRYCLFGNLFARAPNGHTYRIDRHPVMAHHPITPMGEADLRLHLQAQGLDDIKLVTVPDIDTDPAAVAERIIHLSDGGSNPVLLDAVTQAQIDAIGRALSQLERRGPFLLVGSSSVAEAICAAEPRAPLSIGLDQPETSNRPVFLFAGSQSSLTADQIAHATRFQALPLVPNILDEPTLLGELIGTAAVHLRRGQNVLVHLHHDALYRIQGEALARKCAEVVKSIVTGVDLSGIGVAGGDTSSLVLSALNIPNLSHLADLDRGVALCAGQVDGKGTPLALLLKGGQMGQVDLFDRFAAFCQAGSVPQSTKSR